MLCTSGMWFIYLYRYIELHRLYYSYDKMIFECTAVRELSGSKSDRHFGFVCPSKDIVEAKLGLSHPSSDSQASQPPLKSRIENNYNSYLESTES